MRPTLIALVLILSACGEEEASDSTECDCPAGADVSREDINVEASGMCTVQNEGRVNITRPHPDAIPVVLRCAGDAEDKACLPTTEDHWRLIGDETLRIYCDDWATEWQVYWSTP